ncbi:L-2-amino-thiazoline-4-carboxylic acid hydrolase [Pendulispora albinea]|uniref:L-2-amino-thiazoline-4-carboxylic acid hydrolase n=1 Tax=Pendulispora albinea TaxID=2741071 RepID=A0ABZ2LYQ8_9BACT
MTPLSNLELIEAAFFEHLAKAPLNLPDEARAGLPDRIRARAAELCERTQTLVDNDLDRGNVGFAVLAAAAYEVLLAAGLPPSRALSTVDACLNDPLRAWVLDGTRQMLDASPDPFEALTDVSRQREAHYFGPSFAFERPIDDGFGYVLEIRRCMFHEALKACGRTEVQPVLCRADLNWIDSIDPDRHHLRFARPSTFATADVCRMWFMRLEPPRLPPTPTNTDPPTDHGPKDR